MAAEVAVSRSVTSLGGFPGGGTKKNFPVIEHPMVKMDKDNLSVRGQGPLMPPSRQRTFIAMDNGVPKLGLDRSNLPPLGSSSKDWTGRSLSHEVDTLQIMTGGRWYQPSRIVTPPDYSPKAGRWEAGAGFSMHELQYMIAERLDMGFHGVKHLFRNNDPNGNGVVSKEALLKIIYTICGYVSPDQFSKLLKSIGLSGKSAVSFDEFAQCFKNTQKSSKVWLSPAQRVSIVKPNKRPDVSLSYRDGAVTAAFCHSLLKDRARAGDIRVHEVLPESSFEPGGVVIPPQLHDMLTHLGYKLTQEEFNKLWYKYDTSACGVVATPVFLRRLGLDENGKVRPSTSPRHAAPVQMVRQNPNQKPRQIHKPLAYRAAPPRRLPPIAPSTSGGKPSEKEDKENAPSTSPTEEPVKKRRLVKKTPTPIAKLDKISHCLHLKFEEPYNRLLQGMKVFDFLKDGFIARIDFKKVLEEFGMAISVTDLEYFLSRCGVRSINGQITYTDFLMKFFNRAESGLVHRVVSNSPHLFGGGRLPPLDSSTLTAEQMEIRLVDHMHSDFLTLMSTLRKCDKYNLGVVTKYEFRGCIDRLLGYPMSDKQFDELLSEITLDDDGLVPYTTFMETFNRPPGSWNTKQVAGHSVPIVRQEGTPPEVRSLKSEADQLLSHVRAEVAAEEVVAEKELRKSQGMNVKELTDCIAEFFRVKFHSFDKAFKNIDRRMTGRFNVHQFSEMLKQCDLTLLPAEVDRLWETLPVSADNMLSFSTLMRYISSLNKGPPPITDKLPMDFGSYGDIEQDASEMVDKARRVIRERRENKQRELEQYTEQPVHKVEFKKVLGKDTEQMLERLRPEVTQHWEKLKQLLRHMDPAGRTLVACGDMMEVLHTLRVAVSESDTERLLGVFTVPDTGMFNYMEFLRYFTKQRNEPMYTESLNLSTKVEQKISKEWKHLRRAFKKSDTSNSGYLSIDDFRVALASIGVDISGEDLFRILSVFDTDISGKISYEHFLNKILSMPI